MKRWMIVTALALLLSLLTACSISVGVERTRVAEMRTATPDAPLSVTPPDEPSETPTATLSRTPTDLPTATNTPRSSGPRATAAPTRIPATRTPTPRPSATPSLTPSSTVPPTPTPVGSPTWTPTPDVTPPAVLLWDVSPVQAQPGDAVRLSWRAAGESVTIKTMLEDGTFGQFYNNLAQQGTLDVPTDSSWTSQVTYVLEVTEGDETQASQITVNLACKFEWFMDNSPDACPREAAVTVPAAGQYFEHGFMVWSGDMQTISVFYQDGSDYFSTFRDTWQEGMPESDPDLTPPTGLHQPVRGFGLVWRESPGITTETVREHIGWALYQEFGYTLTRQCSDGGSVPTCYQIGPDGSIIAMRGTQWWVYGS